MRGAEYGWEAMPEAKPWRRDKVAEQLASWQMASWQGGRKREHPHVEEFGLALTSAREPATPALIDCGRSEAFIPEGKAMFHQILAPTGNLW